MASPLIAVVGVCASGKTTLVTALLARGYRARRVLQEHSYVPDMWLRLTMPDILIYLDAGIETIRLRRNDVDWPEWIRDLQVGRLSHALAHCDFYLETDLLAPGEVLQLTLSFLAQFRTS